MEAQMFLHHQLMHQPVPLEQLLLEPELPPEDLELEDQGVRENVSSVDSPTLTISECGEDEMEEY